MECGWTKLSRLFLIAMIFILMAGQYVSAQPPFLLTRFVGVIANQRIDLNKLTSLLENAKIPYAPLDESEYAKDLLKHQANSLDEHLHEYLKTGVSIVLFRVGVIEETGEEVYAIVFSGTERTAVAARCSRSDYENTPLRDALRVVKAAIPEADLSGLDVVMSEGWIYPPKVIRLFFEEEYGLELQPLGVSPPSDFREGTYKSMIEEPISEFLPTSLLLATLVTLLALILTFSRKRAKKYYRPLMLNL